MLSNSTKTKVRRSACYRHAAYLGHTPFALRPMPVFHFIRSLQSERPISARFWTGQYPHPYLSWSIRRMRHRHISLGLAVCYIIHRSLGRVCRFIPSFLEHKQFSVCVKRPTYCGESNNLVNWCLLLVFTEPNSRAVKCKQIGCLHMTARQLGSVSNSTRPQFTRLLLSP